MYSIITQNSEEFFDFIDRHINDNPEKLILKYSGNKKMPWLSYAVLQIECRKKYTSKFNSLFKNKRFIFPDRLAAEQATDYAVASYHASLAGKNQKVLDMTAGLGVDALAIAANENTVTAIEINPAKAECLRHNAKATENEIIVLNEDSVKYITSLDSPIAENRFDIIFIDPARRNNAGARTYSFADCTPDLNSLYPQLLKLCNRLYVKASPMLDISYLLTEFPNISEIHIVALNGECKEVLIIGESGFMEVPIIKAINIHEYKPSTILEIYADQLGNVNAPIADMDDINEESYLYIPNAAVMKINCADYLCRMYSDLKKLSVNTSIYVSEQLYTSFPGRCFKIDSIIDGKSLKHLKKSRLGVISRNHPESAEILTKRYQLQSSDTNYLIATRAGSESKPTFLLCTKLYAI